MDAESILAVLPRGDFGRLAEFCFRRNRRAGGAVRCLHTDPGEAVEDYRRELDALPPGECLFVAARRGGEWLGVAGAEFDAALGRGWIRSPLTADGEVALAQRLLQRVVAELPGIGCFDAFVDAGDATLQAVYAGLGWPRVTVHHVMRAEEAGRPFGVPGPEVQRADRATGAAAMALHESLFPQSYLPPPQLLASLDDEHRLFVARDGARAVGYLYAQHRVAEGDGYIDYLGVEPAARGRGVGRALLGAALHWLLGDCRLPHVDLTVRADRTSALGLYERSGFFRRRSGVQWRLQREAAAR